MMSSAANPAQPYQSYKDAPNYGEFRNNGLAAQRLEEMMESINFEHWDQFRVHAEAAKQELDTIGEDHRTILTKHFTSVTSQDFEADVPQALELLSKIASENDDGLSSTRILAGEPVFTYGPEGGSHCVLHDVGIYTGSTDTLPDTGVRATEAWDDDESLLPLDDESDGAFESVASAYNWYFRSYRERNEPSSMFEDCLLTHISEVVLTAMHTRSGWYCLHRKSEAIFMRIDPIQAPGSRWLTVYVSDVYTPGDTVSILHGLLALFRGCKVADDAKLKQFGDMTTRLMSITAQMYERPVSCVKKNDESEDESSDKADPLSITDDEKRMLKRAVDGETLLHLNRGELARYFLVNCCGYLGCGTSGHVVRSRVNGTDFAVKRWNRYEWDVHTGGEGLEALEYEMAIYTYLHKYYPHVLGRIVPRPVAICRERKFVNERAVVMTVVGEETVIKGDHHGPIDITKEVWTIDGEVLSEEDKRAIMKQREENLEELGGLGIQVYDPSFNSRVERIKNGSGERKWHVWTIDLGRYRVFRHGKLLQLDELRSLVYDDPSPR